MKDNWCVGYSAKYTVGVWVGNFSGDPMWNVSGTTGAAPIWLEVMNMLNKNNHNQPNPMPENLIVKNVAFPDKGYQKKEIFIKGTETEVIEQENRKKAVRIIYPSNDSIIAIDPDIPPESQKIFFESSTEEGNLCWVLNGNEVGSANGLYAWTPVKGQYRLELVDGSKQILVKSEFSVR